MDKFLVGSGRGAGRGAMAGGNKHSSSRQSSSPPPVFSGDEERFSKISLDAAKAVVRATPMPSADGIHFCVFNRTNTHSSANRTVTKAFTSQDVLKHRNKPVQRQTSAINIARKVLRTVNANTAAKAAAVCLTIPYDIQVCVPELQARNAMKAFGPTGDQRTRAGSRRTHVLPWV